LKKTDVALLEKFIIENKDLEKLEDIVDEFNIFTSLNIKKNEIRHSNFLSWLLDPNESHGLGSSFLTYFLRRVSVKASNLVKLEPSIIDIDSWNFDNVEIEREQMNIDIIIRLDDQKFICVIENKISAGVRSKQLQTYRNRILAEYPKYKRWFVLLSVEELNPPDKKYVPINYNDILLAIENLLDNKKNKIGPEILTFVNHYVSMLRRYILEDSEIQQLCKKIYHHHKKAIDLIVEYKPDLQLQIKEHLENIIKKDPDWILDHSSKSYIRFIPKKLDFIPKDAEGWTKSKRVLLFEFWSYKQEISLVLQLGPGNSKIRNKIHSICKSNGKLFNGSKTKLKQKYSYQYKKKIVKQSELVDIEETELEQHLKEVVAKCKKNDIQKIENDIIKHQKNILDELKDEED
tara:strand:- start:31 stop:1242 length:1212 start_codon:yes stop_codon:yes gene_type:complete